MSEFRTHSKNDYSLKRRCEKKNLQDLRIQGAIKRRAMMGSFLGIPVYKKIGV